MNSPFTLEQARALARRTEIEAASTPAGKLSELYRLALQRSPTQRELHFGEQFIAAQAHGGAGLSPLEKYAQVLLLSNELAFVD